MYTLPEEKAFYIFSASGLIFKVFEHESKTTSNILAQITSFKDHQDPAYSATEVWYQQVKG